MSKPPAPQLPAAGLFGEPDRHHPKALRLLEYLDEMLREIDQTQPPEDRAFHGATAWAAILRGVVDQDASESWKVFWRR